MNFEFRHLVAWTGALALALCSALTSAARASDPGFVAVAADRGFQGNEEIRDAFDAFAAGRNAELVFATDARTRETLDRAFSRLAERGAKHVVVLPVFMSAADPKFLQVKALLSTPPQPVTFARPFGESYLAVEALADRLRTVRGRGQTGIVVAGYGADGAGSRQRLTRDWQRIADRAADGFGFARVQSIVWDDGKVPEREAKRAESRRLLGQAVQGSGRVAVVPFHFGRRLDGMMSYDAELKQALSTGAEFVTHGPGPEALLATWMVREANRRSVLEPRDIGVILLAHGSDFHWNETMRQAVQPLETRYRVEYVFSMADQPLVERAIRRLENRGARAAVIVRVFGLEDSFKADVERMIGADIEGDRAVSTKAIHAHHAGHGHAGSHGQEDPASSPPARIRSPLPMATVGGVGAHPLFAQALLERARALSREPRSETLILTAHGAGEDSRNEQWLKILGEVAAQMKAGGMPFRDIRFATWREDWPDKRAPWVKAVRAMVEEAGRNGGRALVIPARTNGRGPERTLLEGMEYDLGEGFAPHPLFARWFQAQVEDGMAALRDSR